MNYIIKKVTLVFTILLIALSQSASANSSNHDGHFYVTPKAVITLGDDINHNGHRLEGEAGVGIGIDFGYAFTKNYAIEFDTTYAEADVTGEHNHHIIKDTAEYITYAVNAAYITNLIEDLNLVLKLGYEWEHENIEHLEIKERLSGIDYAIGFEYVIDDNIEVDLEFEGSNVESTRGDSIFFGLKYIF